MTADQTWTLSSSSDPRALAVVDGTGSFASHGPHYSRRTPGARTFTGCGQEIVLVTQCGRAVWAVVRQKTPYQKCRHLPSSGTSRQGGVCATCLVKRATQRYVWRNMLFRNLGAGLSSSLISSATEETYDRWVERYGQMPSERLRTEIGIREVRSANPGYCYLMAGWTRDRVVNGKLYLWAPPIEDTSRSTTRLREEISL